MLYFFRKRPFQGHRVRFPLAKLGGRMPLHHKDFPLILLWSQKAACTTLLKWFFAQIGKLEEAQAYSHFVHDYENAVFKRDENYRKDLIEAFKQGRPCAKFVRDPAARAFSGYLLLHDRRNLSAARPAPFDWPLQLRRRICAEMNGGNNDIEFGFSFASYVAWLEQQDMSTMDEHLKGQYSEAEQQVRPRLYRIENMRAALIELEERFSLKPVAKTRLEELSRSHHHYAKGKFGLAEAQAFVEHPLALVPDGSQPMPAISSKLLRGTDSDRRLRRIFAEDYEHYGY